MSIFKWFRKPQIAVSITEPVKVPMITQYDKYQQERKYKLDLAYTAVGRFFVNKYIRQMTTNGRTKTLKNMRKQGIPVEVSLKIIQVKDHFDSKTT